MHGTNKNAREIPRHFLFEVVELLNFNISTCIFQLSY